MVGYTDVDCTQISGISEDAIRVRSELSSSNLIYNSLDYDNNVLLNSNIENNDFTNIVRGKLSLSTEEGIHNIIQSNSARNVNEIRLMFVTGRGDGQKLDEKFYINHIFDFSSLEEPSFPIFMKTAKRSITHSKRIQRTTESLRGSILIHSIQ